MERDMVASGVRQIAIGAASGWALAALYASPELRERVGVVDVQRLRQAHIDVIIMGGLVAAAGAVDGTPAWAKRATRVGAWTNPLLFAPMAFRQDVMGTRAYQVASVASFAVTTAGWWGVARTAKRWASRG